MNILNSARHIKKHIHIKNTKTASFQNASTKLDLRTTKHGKNFLSTNASQTKQSTVVLAHLKCKSATSNYFKFFQFF